MAPYAAQYCFIENVSLNILQASEPAFGLRDGGCAQRQAAAAHDREHGRPLRQPVLAYRGVQRRQRRQRRHDACAAVDVAAPTQDDLLAVLRGRAVAPPAQCRGKGHTDITSVLSFP